MENRVACKKKCTRSKKTETRHCARLKLTLISLPYLSMLRETSICFPLPRVYGLFGLPSFQEMFSSFSFRDAFFAGSSFVYDLSSHFVCHAALQAMIISILYPYTPIKSVLSPIIIQMTHSRIACVLLASNSHIRVMPGHRYYSTI